MVSQSRRKGGSEEREKHQFERHIYLLVASPMRPDWSGSVSAAEVRALDRESNLRPFGA